MKKQTNINQRIVEYCKAKWIRQVDLANNGVAPKQTINNIFKERYKPNCDFLELLASKYPDLNTRWLLTGKGKMLIDTTKEQ